MHTKFERSAHGVSVRAGSERILIEAWGEGIRVRASPRPLPSDDECSALICAPRSPDDVVITECSAFVRVGKLKCEALLVRTHGQPLEDLRLRFSDAGIERVLLEESRAHFAGPGPRIYDPIGGDGWRIEANFRAHEGELFYGMGQRQHGRLAQDGCVLELAHRNSEVSIPFALSNRGYGMLWNTPATGRAEFGKTLTRWVADSAACLDYWITAGSAKDIVSNFSAAVGRAPTFPEWALGLWQSKLRYVSQDDVLRVAREYKRRELPIACMVIDFFHWTKQGEWKFDPEHWPDPKALVRELRQMNIELVVSVWPTVNPNAETYQRMRDQGWLVLGRDGNPFLREFIDVGSQGLNAAPVAFYDSTNPEAAAFVFEKIIAGYLDHGVRHFWLDACEPEFIPLRPAELRFHDGVGSRVLNAYPHMHLRSFYEGLQRNRQEAPVLLCRSAFAGSQRYGCLLWSGDIQSTFESLRTQVSAGLNAGLSGIGWWTTDVGGFYDGDPKSPDFQELVIRWFQWATFCPVLRLHGFRSMADPGAAHNADAEFAVVGADNELWSFGAEAYAILCDYVFVREKLRPYLRRLFAEHSATGVPLLRPMFLEFPGEPEMWEVSDQHMLGPDLLVAPVLELGQRRRSVRLPVGAEWTDLWSGRRHSGGSTIEVDAPLDQIPLFGRNEFELSLG